MKNILMNSQILKKWICYQFMKYGKCVMKHEKYEMQNHMK